MGLVKKVMESVLRKRNADEIVMLLDFFNPRDYYDVEKDELKIRSLYGPKYFQYDFWQENSKVLGPLIKEISKLHNQKAKNPIKLENKVWDDHMVRESLSMGTNAREVASGMNTVRKAEETQFKKGPYDYREKHRDLMNLAIRDMKRQKDGMMEALNAAGELNYVSFNEEDSGKFVELLKKRAFSLHLGLEHILGSLTREIFILMPLKQQEKLNNWVYRIYKEKDLKKACESAKKYLVERFTDATGFIPCDDEQLGIWGAKQQFVTIKEARKEKITEDGKKKEKGYIPLKDKHSFYSRLYDKRLRGVKTKGPRNRGQIWRITLDSVLDYIKKFEEVYTAEKFKKNKKYFLFSEVALELGMGARDLREMKYQGKISCKTILLEGFGKINVLDYRTVDALKRKFKQVR